MATLDECKNDFYTPPLMLIFQIRVCEFFWGIVHMSSFCIFRKIFSLAPGNPEQSACLSIYIKTIYITMFLIRFPTNRILKD